MTDLRKAARGQSCKLRIPGICLGGTETVVLCHIRKRFYGGSIKPLDVIAFHACAACHDEFDSRTHKSGLNRAELDQIGLGALCEQLQWMAHNNLFDKSLNAGPSKIFRRTA